MDSSKSMINQTGKPWLQYTFALSLGAAFIMLSLALWVADIRPLSGVAMLLSGIILSGLGVVSMIKDHHKGLGVLSLAAGSVILGISSLIFS